MAAKRGQASKVFTQVEELVEKLSVPGLDVKSLVEWQRKDFEALANANKLAYEGMKALSERRSEIIQDAFAQWQAAIEGTISGKENISTHAERLRVNIDEAVENFKELAEMESEARIAAWKVVQERMKENADNLKSMFKTG